MPYVKKANVKPDLADCVLRTGQEGAWRFSGEDLTLPAHHRLYFTCEDRMYYGWKDEPTFDKQCMLIDDSLDQAHAAFDRYCLNLSSEKPRPFVRRAARKVTFPPVISVYTQAGYTEEWTLGIRARVAGFKVNEGGWLHIRLDRWEKREGIDKRMTDCEPTETVILEIPEGTYDYQNLLLPVRIPQSTACIIYTVEGLGYSGEVYLESPSLTSSTGINVIPCFNLTVPRLENMAWMGQSLSYKEWPRFKIDINGITVFEDETFLRIHRYSPVELDIPAGVLTNGENTLSITYTSQYHDVVPVAIREIHILEKPSRLFSIVSCPEVAVWQAPIPILLETEAPDLTLSWESDNLEPVEPLEFPEAGLNVALFRAKRFENDMKLTLRCGEAEAACRIAQSVRGGADPILTGSGDMIYIDNSSLRDTEDYLAWFLENRLGNLITIRPAYRWGGHRTIEPALWQRLTALYTKLNIHYSHMSDGRDLPGIACNPHPSMLAGSHFLGRQLHERDGQLFYWGFPTYSTLPVNDVFYDITQRMYRETPDTVEAGHKVGAVMVNGGKVCEVRYVDCQPDMKDAHDTALKSLKIVRGDYPRHTGPSVMFKYFYEAGFEWTGAETMDSSHETLLSALRGAAKAYGKKSTGVHLAVQWSTHPHNTQQRFRRYLLALYVPYLQGVTEVNTEEGWWFQESWFSFFNRFCDGCIGHRMMAQRFYRFVSTHTRTGRYYTPYAFLHGRYDGFYNFGMSQNLFGMPHLQAGEAEDSWKLLKLFYPLNHVRDAMDREHSVTGYFPEGTDHPRGCYSGTPRGNVDTLPIEKGVYNDYKLLCFAGYNAADKEDFDNLLGAVEAGRVLLGAWPHFSTTTWKMNVDNHNHTYLDHPLVRMLSQETPQFVQAHLGGAEITVCQNPPAGSQVLETTDEGLPLVYSIPCGEGKIVFVNCVAYPGNAIIRPVYERALCQCRDDLAFQEPSEIFCGENVQYAIYLQEDGSRHYYLTPVDWYRDPEPLRSFTLRVGKEQYPMSLPFGQIRKLVVSGDVAAWTVEDTAEVVSVTEGEITVQGRGFVTLRVVRNGREEEMIADCSLIPVQHIRI